MTCDFNLLLNVQTLIKPFYVNLPNSQRFKVTQAGFVFILQNVTISNVLYVPSDTICYQLIDFVKRLILYSFFLL